MQHPLHLPLSTVCAALCCLLLHNLRPATDTCPAPLLPPPPPPHTHTHRTCPLARTESAACCCGVWRMQSSGATSSMCSCWRSAGACCLPGMPDRGSMSCEDVYSLVGTAVVATAGEAPLVNTAPSRTVNTRNKHAPPSTAAVSASGSTLPPSLTLPSPRLPSLHTCLCCGLQH